MLFMFQINRIIFINIILLTAFLINGCQHSSKLEATSETERIHILPFEKELFGINQQIIAPQLDSLSKKYGSFYDIYFSQIMQFGSTKNPEIQYIIADYIKNQDFLALAHDCDSIYNDQKRIEIEQQLTEISIEYKKLFPNDTFPEIVSFISGFNNGIVTTDKHIGIGIDLFLGPDYRFYSSLDLPEFLLNRYSPEHLIPSFLKGLYTYKYSLIPENKTLLDNMIYEGKQLYWISHFAPNIDDSLKIGYTKQQMDWCNINEANIYKLLVSENLFTTDYLQFRKYVDETPFTSNLGKESAPRIGAYCGWKIIDAYMKNSQSSILDMMKENDAQKILKIAKYKP